MILLSNSIAKTGSTLLANYQDDILKKLDVRSGQSKVWTSYKGRYIDIPNKTRLLKLLIWNIDLLTLRKMHIVKELMFW